MHSIIPYFYLELFAKILVYLLQETLLCLSDSDAWKLRQFCAVIPQELKAQPSQFHEVQILAKPLYKAKLLFDGTILLPSLP